MTAISRLNIQEILPLTCSRAGTCCHGKLVLLNPWELMCLAKEKRISAKEFMDQYCEYGGIRLRFDGKGSWKGDKACSQYVENFGCGVHSGRPLACRLYPLGRQIQSGEVQYIFQGDRFPCLEDCSEVTTLPHLSVGEYLNEQQTFKFEQAQDEYLEIMQNLADIAFALLIDTGLAASGDKKTLQLWKAMGEEEPEKLAQHIGPEWLQSLMLPDVENDFKNPAAFAQQHNELLQNKAQERFGNLQSFQELHEASVLMMAVALHLARGIGANPKILAEHWIETAKSLGAAE